MNTREHNWPPNYPAEVERRLRILDMCRADTVKREAFLHFYSKNPLQWINDFGITYDPRRKTARTIPFILFQRQIEFIHFLQGCIADKESGLIEKSRDIGATWLCAAFSVWMWRFQPGSSIGWGSRDQDTVDLKGNPDSIFEKMRMQIAALPSWMMPVGFDERMHQKFMTITNPENGSSIKGDAGDNIGRGGRSGVYFKDESAWYEHPEQIEAALGDNTEVQIDISSVHGTANVFYRRRMAGEVWYPGSTPTKGKVRVFIFDWRDHPGKTQSWYDDRKARYVSEGLGHIVAQEIDRDYSSSVVRTIIPADWVRSAIDAHIKLGIKEDGQKVAALDVADEGGDKNALAVNYGVVLKHCEAWPEGDTGQTANYAFTKAMELGCTELDYDCIGVGAGVKSETNRLIREGTIPDWFRIEPWNAGENPENPEQHMIEGDEKSPKNEDFYFNRKAQAWWTARLRFERTHKAVTQGIIYPHDQLISLSSEIPVIHQLVQELSQPVWTHNTKGKMLVDKKPEGALSPNMADAVIMVNMPMRNYAPGLGYLEFLGKYAEDEKARRLTGGK